MFQTMRLGRCFGIDLYVHWTFWFLPFVVALNDFSNMVSNVLFVFALFGCIVLHEIGHSLAARGYGIGTRDITLYPIGGVASLERMPEKPGREIAIALAGPAVNLAIAGALFVGLSASSSLLGTASGKDPLEFFAFSLLDANLFLCAFNLLPAFPMDGGRVLRALLALRMTRIRATEIAAGVGTVLAGALLIFGLLTSKFFLMLLAMAVYALGQKELAMVRLREAGRAFRMRAEWPHEAEGESPSPGFSGLAWDATRRSWVEWKNGFIVRVVPTSPTSP